MSSISANAADSTTAVTPSARATDNRAQWLDVGRVVAMLTIVHLHTMEEGVGWWLSNWKTWAGVPVFCAAAALLVFGWPPSSPRRAFWPYVRQRFVRLYVPFLGWATIYSLSRWAASFVVTSAHPPILDGWWLLRGTVVHLWFLPYLTVASVVVYVFARSMPRKPGIVVPVCIALGAGGVVLSLYVKDWVAPFNRELYLFFYAMPSTMWGMALGYIASAFGLKVLRHPGVTLAALAIFLVTLTLQYANIDRSRLTVDICGVALFVVCLWDRPIPAPRFFAKLGALSFGVYLSHFLFTEGLQDFFRALKVPTTDLTALVVFVLSVILAFVTAYVLRLSRYTAWLSP